MAKLITVYWREIPAQVIARRGRETLKLPLSKRFHDAIDRAAMRAGKGSSDLYLEEWRRVPRNFAGDLQETLDAEAAKLEAAYSDEQLEKMIKAGGIEPEGHS